VVRGRLRGDEVVVLAAVRAVVLVVVRAAEWAVVVGAVAVQAETVYVPPAATVCLMCPGSLVTRSNALPAGQAWSYGKYPKGITTCR
jgi:hypothetical protein